MLYEINKNRTDLFLMILIVEKLFQDDIVNDQICNEIKTYIKEMLPDASSFELKQLLNLISHPNTKQFIQEHLDETTLNNLWFNFNENYLLSIDCLLRDIFLTKACDPTMLLQPNGDIAFIAFVKKITLIELTKLIQQYKSMLPNFNNLFKNKLNELFIKSALDNPILSDLLPLLFEWSIAHSPFTTENDELISHMPLLLEKMSSETWVTIDDQLQDINNPYIGSLQLLKRMNDTKDCIDFLTKNSQLIIRNDACILFIIHQSNLNNNLLIEAIDAVLKQKISLDIEKILNALPYDIIESLLKEALSGMTSEHYHRAQACRTLLTYLSQTSFKNQPSYHAIVKKRLGFQDFSFLNEEDLINLAHSTLNLTEKSLETETYDGIWIQRLITSIPFVAKINPNLLHQLIERYRLISLRLKQDELDCLNQWISGKFVNKANHSNALERIRIEMLEDPSRREHLLNKRHRLLDFRADDSIRALFNQLENDCVAQIEQDDNDDLANQALTTLYAYYNQRLSGLRCDYLFKISDSLVSNMSRGDIDIARNALVQWFYRFLPHYNFEQRELVRKYESFIDEQDNLFQHNTCALMVAKIPQSELEQSKPALSLLMYDLLHQGELKTVYENLDLEQDSEKITWLEKELQSQFSGINHPLPSDTIISLAIYHSDISVLAALETMPHHDNAFLLFKTILELDDKRDALFEQGLTALTHCLNRHKAVDFFSEYLLCYHDKPWFTEGLSLFAKTQSSNDKRAFLLLDALDSLTTDRDAILTTLVSTETNAHVVLTEFLSCNDDAFIQSSHNLYVKAFTSCFLISDITCMIQSLPTNSPWLTLAQYRMILMTFLYQFNRLFPPKELRLSTQHAWHANDLIALTQFTKKHFIKGNSIDKDFKVGQKILAELAVRTANFGQTNLFYNDNTFNIEMAYYILSRSAFDGLIEQVSSVVTNTLSSFKTSQAPQDESTIFLEDEGAIIDWEEIKKQTWRLSKNNKLPLLTAFLVNYSGEKRNINQLINDILDKSIAMTDKTIVHYITQLLRISPNSDISAVIFNQINTRVIQNPNVLDGVILSDLACFYSSRVKKSKNIDLIKYFGQQKQYSVVLKLCQLLKPSKEQIELTQLINQIKKEAQVELSLSSSTGKWYFPIMAFFVRRWHYAGKQPSEYVAFCNKPATNNIERFKCPNTIHTNVLGGETIEAHLKHHEIINQAKSIKTRLEQLDTKRHHFFQGINDVYQEEQDEEDVLDQTESREPTNWMQ